MVVQNGSMFSGNGALQWLHAHATMINPGAPAATNNATGLCKYPSKKCLNPRVIKRNGELHNFCEYHRQKANENQRRMEHRRKLNRLLTRQQAVTAAGSANVNGGATTAAPVGEQANHQYAIQALGCNIQDDSAFHGVELSDVDMALDFELIDTEGVAFGLALGNEEMQVIDMEPFNKPFELLEEDLYFLDRFMHETSAF